MYKLLKNKRQAFLIPSIAILIMAIALGWYYFQLEKVSRSVDEVEFLIGVSQANLTEPWRINMNNEIKAEALKHKNIRIIFTNASQNSHKQIRDVDELLQQGIDLLIISPNDSTFLTSVVAKAHKKIPVIVMDRGVEGYDYTLHIGPDNWLIGKEAGKYIVDLLGEKDSNVVEIQGPLKSPSVRERSAGFREALGQNPNIQVTNMTVANWRRDTAEDEMTELLKRQSHIDAIFAHSDYMAVGAYNTVKKLGEEGIKVIGINDFADPANGFKLVEEGILQATFICPSGGQEAVQYALDILLKGEQGIPKKIITRSRRITREEVLANVNTIKRLTKLRNHGQKIVLGFSQFGIDEKWRNAQSESIQQAAREMEIELKFRDSGSALLIPLNKVQEDQIKAIRSFITEKVDGIILAPVIDYGWDEVLQEAKAAAIPVFLASSRNSVQEDSSLYAFRIGSDLVEQGRRAARWIANARPEQVQNIVELEGPVGRAPTIERKKGFNDVIVDYPELRAVFSASGNFTKSGGKTAMKSALEEYGSYIHAVFAHNDNMALGAIEAIEEYGLIPGQDITIISVDATQEAFGAMADGKLNCTIEYTPIIGPQLMQAVKGYMEGRPLPLRIIVSEEVFPIEKAMREYEKRLY